MRWCLARCTAIYPMALSKMDSELVLSRFFNTTFVGHRFISGLIIVGLACFSDDHEDPVEYIRSTHHEIVCSTWALCFGIHLEALSRMF
mmetsp:Transcript_64163/g.126786  ORF Transcript_64163/g.126786 Transcript_64163/m.126786 type:complete len:89 (+) Transcript_64163:127-393(+)|eukprot:CAMPEP_0174697608 /NCGR_PEP_ID=MMETSP1094-20130205/3423_1 /TAXON_ID=156173 /ORGANISM="Chrysochromulina brevifilum, Strain UTEX LB 985" /LENGTH=88 /DNA_ID=CAMNT_0015894615 /DNA_START=107 /DNA_END=373 /DNA_ORIENTATION=-